MTDGGSCSVVVGGYVEQITETSERAREIELDIGEPTRYGIKRKPRIKKSRRRTVKPVPTSVQGIRG